MALQWKAVLPQDMCILSRSAIADHLAMASHLQLKVLLWFAVNDCDINACAAALHKSPDVIAEAAQYWVANGVLLSDDTPAPAAVPTPVPAAEEPTVPQPVVRPAAVKPQMRDVIRRQQESAEFSNLLQDVSARFGRPITHGDMETLLYLYDTAGIPAAVILMVVGYAVSCGKINMRYIEKTALNWQDDGITTFAAAEEHLLLLQQMDAAAAQVQAMTGKARALDYRQRGMAHTWLYVWNLPEDMIHLAIDQAAKTTKSLIPYANSILNRWYDEGIRDAAAAAATLQQTAADKRRGQTEQTSLDLPTYEKMLETYVPTLPKKKRKE